MNEHFSELNIFERVICIVFRKCIHRVYRQGIIDGYNWAKKKKKSNK